MTDTHASSRQSRAAYQSRAADQSRAARPSRAPGTPQRARSHRWLAQSLLAGLAVAPMADAQSWYEVEMVAFTRNPAQVVTVEQATPAQALVMPARFWAFSLDPLVSGGSQLRAEPLNHLASAHNRLKRTGKYQVLFGAAWKQPLTTETDSLPLVVTGAEAAPGVYGLEGTLMLSHQRFLHASLNLGYSELLRQETLESIGAPASIDGSSPTHGINQAHLTISSQPPALLGPRSAESAEPATLATDSPAPSSEPGPVLRMARDGSSQWRVGESFQIAGLHRLRPSAVNYIDHPHLGVLLYARPIEAPAPEPTLAPDDLTDPEASPEDAPTNESQSRETNITD